MRRAHLLMNNENSNPYEFISRKSAMSKQVDTNLFILALLKIMENWI